MESLTIIEKTRNFVKAKLKDAEKGHDWFHIERVYKLALKLAKTEGGDMFVIQMAALLHDISDAKFNGGDETAGKMQTIKFLKSLNLSNEKLQQIAGIVDKVSFKGGLNDEQDKSIELQIVQDADRLDAIGAIGIARTFHYGGYKNREIYNPARSPQKYQSVEEYHKSDSPTINHFYEKLLLLKDRMNTVAGRQLAQKRHAFMEQFLEEFYAEWEGSR